MNKTIVVSVGIITSGLTIIAGMGLFYALKTTSRKEVGKEIASMASETRDRMTVCIDTIMQRSKEVGKPIDAKEAREICG